MNAQSLYNRSDDAIKRHQEAIARAGGNWITDKRDKKKTAKQETLKAIAAKRIQHIPKPKKPSRLDLLALRARKAKGYRAFLETDYWQEVRKLVLERDSHKCVICKGVVGLQVHHDNYKNHFNEHNNLPDLVTLCAICHKDYHFNIDQNFRAN